MEFLLDQNTDGFDKKLIELGHKVEYVRKLREKDPKFRNDLNVIKYAQEHNMILITKDKEPGQACEDNKIPCIWLSDERIFDEMILPRLKNM
jgi:predicted nuclease of predicted toxin-antitoxin system